MTKSIPMIQLANRGSIGDILRGFSPKRDDPPTTQPLDSIFTQDPISCRKNSTGGECR